MDKVQELNLKKRKKTRRNKTGNIDFIMLAIVLIMLFCGVMMVYSSSAYYALYENNSTEYFFKKEFIWTLVGLCAMAFTMSFDYHKYKRLTGLVLIVTLGLLIAVFFFGVELNGAKRWIRIAGVSLQPSEIAKFAVILYLAKVLDSKINKVAKFKNFFIYLTVCGTFAALVLLQRSLSVTAIIMISSFIILFLGGAKILHMLPIGGLGLIAGIILIKIQPYRAERLTSFLNPWADPTGASYQLIQSLYAIASGGFFGVGLGDSRQKALFMPEPHNDFIFAIIGEEFGLVGGIFVIGLFIFLLIRGTYIASIAKDYYGFLLTMGIITVIGVQAIINIAVVTGSMPVTGVPLPLISYGGTSLVINLAALGIVLNVSRHKKENKGEISK